MRSIRRRPASAASARSRAITASVAATAANAATPANTAAAHRRRRRRASSTARRLAATSAVTSAVSPSSRAASVWRHASAVASSPSSSRPLAPWPRARHSSALAWIWRRRCSSARRAATHAANGGHAVIRISWHRSTWSSSERSSPSIVTSRAATSACRTRSSSAGGSPAPRATRVWRRRVSGRPSPKLTSRSRTRRAIVARAGVSSCRQRSARDEIATASPLCAPSPSASYAASVSRWWRRRLHRWTSVSWSSGSTPGSPAPSASRRSISRGSK